MATLQPRISENFKVLGHVRYYLNYAISYKVPVFGSTTWHSIKACADLAQQAGWVCHWPHQTVIAGAVTVSTSEIKLPYMTHSNNTNSFNVLTIITYLKLLVKIYSERLSKGFFLIFVVPSIMLHSSEISPTRCDNCVFILRNGFTLHVSGDNLTHHQEYICCIWPQVSRLT